MSTMPRIDEREVRDAAEMSENLIAASAIPVSHDEPAARN